MHHNKEKFWPGLQMDDDLKIEDVEQMFPR